MSKLPASITDSHLWKYTLSSRINDEYAEAREHLRNAFVTFRQRAGYFANEIRRDLPQLTLHELNHIDALWETASTIVGEDFELTPTEGFVLGGAFLLHDLGMALPSVEGGIAALKVDPRWADFVTYEYQTKYDRNPTSDEIQNPDKPIYDQVLLSLMQQIHASNAERIIFTNFNSKHDSDPIYLVDDTELRKAFGKIIGQIAHSHHWKLSELEEQFQNTIGAPGAPHWFPPDWTIDPLKIACVLRCADAAQIDARRAPMFLRALSELPDASNNHWVFQEKLNKPYIDGDALVFTSGPAFNMREAPAWWLCFETLRMVNRELGSVDALFADKEYQRFAVRRVAGIEDPNRLVSYIQTVGWLPINATVHVSDLPRVIKSIGGEELYGHCPEIALRELVQNASDAIHARRIYEEREQNYGTITVSLKKCSDSKKWLEIRDDGIGMSQKVLTDFLLDFGHSFWGSSEMQREFPGLLSSGLNQTGKYGIGFFSVFMIADHVKVITRRSDAATKDTLVLEFSIGLQGRPILREANTSEQLLDGGTLIRLDLHTDPDDLGGLLHTPGKRPYRDLSELCVSLCPALEVDLNVEEEDVLKHVIKGGDWKTMDAYGFLRRIPILAQHDDITGEDIELFCQKAAPSVRTLKDENGEVVGRALITVGFAHEERNRTDLYGVVTIGGLTACRLTGIAGVLSGKSMRASRDTAKPIVADNELKVWAEGQNTLVPKLWDDPKDQVACAKYIRLCGGHTGDLPICQIRDTWYSANDISSRTDLPDVVVILDDFVVDYLSQHVGPVSLNENVFVVQTSGIPGLLQCQGQVEWPRKVFKDSSRNRDRSQMTVAVYSGTVETLHMTLGGVVVESIAKAWNVDVQSLCQHNSLEKESDMIIGSSEYGDVKGRALVVSKPQ